MGDFKKLDTSIEKYICTMYNKGLPLWAIADKTGKNINSIATIIRRAKEQGQIKVDRKTYSPRKPVDWSSFNPGMLCVRRNNDG